MNKIRSLVLGLLALLFLFGKPAAGAEVRYDLHFPNLPGYQTLACDLHLHTVFSDGDVWPTVRVVEGWRQGLHALSITDHIEYQPHKKDLPTQHNRPYELAEPTARSHNILLVKGTEITRKTPPGHFNALFLNEVQPLDTKDLLEALKQAHEQGAFVFWCHQAWKGEAKGKWLEVHTTLFQNQWFQGMEICNGKEYYPKAHAWCLEKKLTMLGNTDEHDPDLRRRSKPSDHKTLTLVFAKDRTLAGLKDALMNRRTLVWFGNKVIGQEEWLRPFFTACVRVGQPNLRTKKGVYVEIHNSCEADIRLERKGELGPKLLKLPARANTLVYIALPDPTKPVELKYLAKNFLVAPKRSLPVALIIPGP